MLEALLLKAAPWLAGLAVAVLGYFAGRSAGKDKVKVEQAERQLQDGKKIGEADAKVAKMDSDAIRDELARFVRKRD